MSVPARWVALADEIELAVTSRLDDLSARQATFKAGARGRYWQGVRWPEPADGATKPVDKDLSPVHQSETWRDFGMSLPDSAKFSLSVDIYEGPNGHGYSVTVYVRLDGQLWVRTWDGAEAPEPRARAWEVDTSGD